MALIQKYVCIFAFRGYALSHFIQAPMWLASFLDFLCLNCEKGGERLIYKIAAPPPPLLVSRWISSGKLNKISILMLASFILSLPPSFSQTNITRFSCNEQNRSIHQFGFIGMSQPHFLWNYNNIIKRFGNREGWWQLARFKVLNIALGQYLSQTYKQSFKIARWIFRRI